MSYRLEQLELEFKSNWKKKIGIKKHAGKVRKCNFQEKIS